jgi:hypothetical protein
MIYYLLNIFDCLYKNVYTNIKVFITINTYEYIWDSFTYRVVLT